MIDKILDMAGRWGNDLTGVFFPDVCEVCGTALVGDERVICAHCDYDMPRTNWHRDDFNEMHRRVLAHARIDRAAAMFHYSSSGRFADIIRNAKYRGRPKLLREIARKFARELQADNFFDGMDIIEPVPMPWLKRLIRGYNQTEYLAEGLSDVTGIPVGDHIRARLHRAQARSNAAGRAANVVGKYYLRHTDELRGLHILLVDDIITTGSTLRVNAELIHDALGPDYHLSLLTIGATGLQ